MAPPQSDPIPDYADGADYQRRLQQLVDGIAGARYRATLDFAAGVKAGREVAARAARLARAAAAAERGRRVSTTAPPAPRRSTAHTAPRPAPPAMSGGGSMACGGDLPPCYVMMRESRGNPRAYNPSSGASGKWQFLRSTWANFGGYAEARDAPASVQDAKARIVYNHGAGCGAWSSCG